MAKFTNEQVDIMRDDMDSDYGYTKIRMTCDFLRTCEEENPGISHEELMEKLKEFRKEKGWDETDEEESK